MGGLSLKLSRKSRKKFYRGHGMKSSLVFLTYKFCPQTYFLFSNFWWVGEGGCQELKGNTKARCEEDVAPNICLSKIY